MIDLNFPIEAVEEDGTGAEYMYLIKGDIRNGIWKYGFVGYRQINNCYIRILE